MTVPTIVVYCDHRRPRQPADEPLAEPVEVTIFENPSLARWVERRRGRRGRLARRLLTGDTFLSAPLTEEIVERGLPGTPRHAYDMTCPECGLSASRRDDDKFQAQLDAAHRVKTGQVDHAVAVGVARISLRDIVG